jgi:hypothetical protein
MPFQPLDPVALLRDLPAHGLRRGDLGVVVQRYAPDGLEVEFATASGCTESMVTLTTVAVRSVQDRDLLTVRPADRPS